jgi:hypothetical protein
VARAAELGAASYVERFKAAKGTAKSIAFYDLALLTDLAELYRSLARRRLEQAAADPRIKPTAEYYLAEALSGPGELDQAAAMAQSFIARPEAPAQYRERSRARLAWIAYRQGRQDEAERAWAALAERSSDAEVLAAVVIGCGSAGAQCAKALARAGQVAEAGDARRNPRLNFALGAYWLRKHDPRARHRLHGGRRDKSNKNKIEANDPKCSRRWPRPTTGPRNSPRDSRSSSRWGRNFPWCARSRRRCRACTDGAAQRGRRANL